MPNTMIRWKRALWVGVFALSFTVFGVRGFGTEPSSNAEIAAAAQRALAPFKQKLMAALRAGLAQGPDEAVAACREQAPEIASSLTTATLRMGRTSDRLRNPQNRPEPWMWPLLDEFLAAAPGEIDYRVVSTGPDSMGYVEPIYVQPLCLTCHGAAVAPAIRDRLHAAYSEDRATDYAVGDFRGLFWVEIRESNGDG
jgi:hypothetical protein